MNHEWLLVSLVYVYRPPCFAIFMYILPYVNEISDYFGNGTGVSLGLNRFYYVANIAAEIRQIQD